MSAEHKRPLFAFVVVTIVCAAMLGHAIRTDALPGLLAPLVERVTVAAPGAGPTAPESSPDGAAVTPVAALGRGVAVTATLPDAPAVQRVAAARGGAVEAVVVGSVISAREEPPIAAESEATSGALVGKGVRTARQERDAADRATAKAERVAERAARAADRATAKAQRAAERAARPTPGPPSEPGPGSRGRD